ncbi:MAG: hypothetical protein KAS17_06840 [Victivallaceae bacterium]|nr:hypothetical protein [Victivallaceae bacterium]
MSEDKKRLRQICIKGLKKRYRLDYKAGLNTINDEEKNIVNRMEYELDIIEKGKFCCHFLAISDILSFARQKAIPVGTGRGASVGSLIAYLCDINDIDPLKYDLLFECFINPISLNTPHFEIDICQRRYDEVMEYIVTKYGNDCVSQVASYGRFTPKRLVRDIAQVFKRNMSETDFIIDLIPCEEGMTLKKSPSLRHMAEKHSWINEMFKHVEILEGLNRSMGVHCGRIVINANPLAGLVPLVKAENGEIMTEYPFGICKKLGLFSFDMLVFREITFIQDVIDNIKKTIGESIDWSTVTLKDEATFDLLSKKDTDGIFLLQGRGMQIFCNSFHAKTINDLILMLSISSTHHFPQSISHEYPELQDIISETRGILIYTEQVMQILHQIAAFTLAEVARLRACVLCGDSTTIEQQKTNFISSCYRKTLIRAYGSGKSGCGL